MRNTEKPTAMTPAQERAEFKRITTNMANKIEEAAEIGRKAGLIGTYAKLHSLAESIRNQSSALDGPKLVGLSGKPLATQGDGQ